MRRFWYFHVSKWSGGKNLAFQCCAKMVGLLQHGSILHGLNSQVTPKDSQSSFDIPKYHPDTPRLSLRHPKTSPNSIRHYRHRRISSIIQGGYLVRQYMRSWTKVEPSYHFSTTLKGKIFFHLIILKHQNTKTAAYMLSKNHWVSPFFAFFRFIREILFVTVALDHPVSLHVCSPENNETSFVKRSRNTERGHEKVLRIIIFQTVLKSWGGGRFRCL